MVGQTDNSRVHSVSEIKSTRGKREKKPILVLDPRELREGARASLEICWCFFGCAISFLILSRKGKMKWCEVDSAKFPLLHSRQYPALSSKSRRRNAVMALQDTKSRIGAMHHQFFFNYANTQGCTRRDCETQGSFVGRTLENHVWLEFCSAARAR